MIFRPKIWIKNVLEIDKEFLDKHNIKAMVLDLDNTLSMHGNPAAEIGVPEWLVSMRELGIPMRVVSNNTNKRVKPLAEKLGLPYCANGCKPLTFGVSRAIKQMGVSKKQTAVIGDQIFTDVMAGNFKGAISILVEPFHLEKTWTFRLKRKIESLIFKRDYSKLEIK
ncbi:MAG: YqeG family HAD IIIA-type phosphatase [Ruminiclostridium sp.]|nr:YqeG family HAD IIIA-type phosphatase [Ruminiclostridium sp.]